MTLEVYLLFFLTITFLLLRQYFKPRSLFCKALTYLSQLLLCTFELNSAWIVWLVFPFLYKHIMSDQPISKIFVTDIPIIVCQVLFFVFFCLVWLHIQYISTIWKTTLVLSPHQWVPSVLDKSIVIEFGCALFIDALRLMDMSLVDWQISISRHAEWNKWGENERIWQWILQQISLRWCKKIKFYWLQLTNPINQ